jgi:hypothetical protein
LPVGGAVGGVGGAVGGANFLTFLILTLFLPPVGARLEVKMTKKVIIYTKI